jgi:hypothetical protein
MLPQDGQSGIDWLSASITHQSLALLTEWTIMAGQDGRMLFCAMRAIQRHAATPVATITEFADDPSKRQRDNHLAWIANLTREALRPTSVTTLRCISATRATN